MSGQEAHATVAPARQAASPAAVPGVATHVSPTTALGFRVIALVFLVALGLRVLHVLAMTGSPYFRHPVIDADAYDRAAQAIASGHGHPDGVFWQPPGYAYFLGALYAFFGRGGLLVPRLVQAVLGALASVCTGWIGARLFGPMVGFAAGLGTAVYGTLIYFDGELLTPSLTIALQLAALALALKARSKAPGGGSWFFVAGVAAGLAAVATATSLVLLPLLAGFARRRAIAVLAGAALAIAPVTVRNVVRGGELVLISSNAGMNLYIGNNARYDETVGIRPDRNWITLYQEPARHGIHGAAAASSYFVRRVAEFVVTDPVGFLRLQARKLYLTLGGDEIYRSYAIYPARAWSPVLRALLWKIPGLAFPFGVLLPLAIVGIAVSGRRAPLLVGALGLYTAGIVAFFVAARYRAPIVPLLVIFAAEGGRWLLQDATRTQRVKALVAAAAVFALANVNQGAMSSTMNPDAELSLAAGLTAEGREADAVALYESVVGRTPDYLEAWVNLGVLRARAGRRLEAEQALARAMAIDPRNPHALASLGTLRWRAGDLETARALYEAALAADPMHAAARASLAALLRQAETGGRPP